jgi:hypothetical protein
MKSKKSKTGKTTKTKHKGELSDAELKRVSAGARSGQAKPPTGKRQQTSPGGRIIFVPESEEPRYTTRKIRR